MKIKKFFISFIVIVLISASAYVVLKPKSFYHFSDGFDHWNANFLRKILHMNRKWLDASFRDNVYTSYFSKTHLDIIMPIVEKDIKVAREAIKSARSLVFHPIDNIYIVAPESKRIRDFAKEVNCIFVEESTVMDDFQDVRKHGGWIIQQFIKLNANRISKSENILILDADTLFLRPQVFISDRKKIYSFNIHTDYFPQRKKFTQKLFKTNTYFKLCFVSHHMLFNRQWLQEMKDELENIYKTSWQKAMLEHIKKDSYSFSEYEIYASYVFRKHRSSVRMLSSANVYLYRDYFKHFDLQRCVYAQDFKSVSSHSFMKSPQ